MSNVLVIGASGQIGKQATQKLLNAGHNVTALLRNKDKISDITHSALSVYEQDLEDDFSAAFEGCDSVVFCAGSGGNTGPEKTLLIDLWAARNAVEYAREANIQQFVMVSSVGSDDPDAIDSPIKPYLVAKHMADEHLRNSGLNYTILRPGSLTDEPGTEYVQELVPSNDEARTIPREDVATAIMYSVDNPKAYNRIYGLFTGDQPLKAVIQ
ncbi:SDR family oxidoreductase [Salinimonas sediminis]|uniref:SDR family oxidoreductase n=1 Tax=Salinimonas sediminis TaxID=2303538 RepID=A0A346NLA3_9ALTE|nr:SDR family oxidoreductase [Salinimonas sediminis]AXR06310.1 SDR family oxidoreductase [Salinimonas sediminis]